MSSENDEADRKFEDDYLPTSAKTMMKSSMGSDSEATKEPDSSAPAPPSSEPDVTLEQEALAATGLQSLSAREVIDNSAENVGQQDGRETHQPSSTELASEGPGLESSEAPVVRSSQPIEVDEQQEEADAESNSSEYDPLDEDNLESEDSDSPDSDADSMASNASYNDDVFDANLDIDIGTAESHIAEHQSEDQEIDEPPAIPPMPPQTLVPPPPSTKATAPWITFDRSASPPRPETKKTGILNLMRNGRLPSPSDAAMPKSTPSHAEAYADPYRSDFESRCQYEGSGGYINPAPVYPYTSYSNAYAPPLERPDERYQQSTIYGTPAASISSIPQPNFGTQYFEMNPTPQFQSAELWPSGLHVMHQPAPPSIMFEPEDRTVTEMRPTEGLVSQPTRPHTRVTIEEIVEKPLESSPSPASRKRKASEIDQEESTDEAPNTSLLTPASSPSVEDEPPVLVATTVEPPRKKAKTEKSASVPSFVKYAATAATGALVGAVGLFGLLVALPHNYFE